MSPVAYDWGTERPSQRIKRLRKLVLKQDEAIAKLVRDVATEIERISMAKCAYAHEIKVLERILQNGRIDRARAAEHQALFDQPMAPQLQRTRGRPRKHLLSQAPKREPQERPAGVPKLKGSEAPIAQAENPTPVALKPLPVEAEAAFEPAAQMPSAVPRAHPEHPLEPSDEAHAGTTALEALRALDLSGVQTLPSWLLKAFPYREFPRAYSRGGEGDPETVSYTALSDPEKERWIVEIGYGGVREHYDEEVRRRGGNTRYLGLYEAQTETLMARETALPLVLGAVAARIGLVLAHQHEIVSGHLTPLQEALSQQDTTELARMGPRTQETWWCFVDAVPWPNGLSRAEIMAFDGRHQFSDPAVFAVWDPTGKERDSRGIFIDPDGAAKRREAAAERERTDKLRIRRLIEFHDEGSQKREHSKQLFDLLVKSNRRDLLAKYFPHLEVLPSASHDNADSSDTSDTSDR